MEVFTLPRKAENRSDLSFQPSSVKCMNIDQKFYNLHFLNSETDRNKT